MQDLSNNLERSRYYASNAEHKVYTASGYRKPELRIPLRSTLTTSDILAMQYKVKEELSYGYRWYCPQRNSVPSRTASNQLMPRCYTRNRNYCWWHYISEDYHYSALWPTHRTKATPRTSYTNGGIDSERSYDHTKGTANL